MEKKPSYARVYHTLKQQIMEGEYPVGKNLPPESELEQVFSVSRITVRRAIEMLQREGFVKAQRGKGTLVLDYLTRQRLNQVTSVSETLESKGYKVVPKDISIERVRVNAKLAQEFGIEENAEVVHVRRIQTADGKPIAIMNNYLKPEMVPGIETHAKDIIRLYDYLEETHGIVIDNAVERIKAKNASLQEAEMLRIPIGTALISISRTCYRGAEAVCVDHVNIIGDYYEYEVVMRGRYRH